jgi:hypothetical protein
MNAQSVNATAGRSGRSFTPMRFEIEMKRRSSLSGSNLGSTLIESRSKARSSQAFASHGDFPLAWAKTYGKGRVFYLAFGHAAATWDNPDIYRMYFEALKWSLGLTDADVTPRPLK